MIAVDSATLAALSDAKVRLALFLELELDGAVFVRYCTAGTNLQWQPPSAGSPVAWQGMGSLMAIDPVREAGGLEVIGWMVTLSGVPSDLLSLAAAEDVVGRRATAWIAVYDEAGAIVGSPFKRFEGRINDMPIEDEPKDSKVRLRIESRLIAMQRAPNSYWTQADQRKRYSTDDGFRFTEITAARTLRFGPKQ